MSSVSVGRVPEPPGDAPSARQIAAQLSWLGAGEVVGQVAWYAVVLVLAAILDPKAFGTVAAGMAVVRVANMITAAGTGGSLIAARELTMSDVRAALRRTIVAAAIFSVAIAISGDVLARAFAAGGDPEVLRVLAFSVTLAAVSVVPQALLKKALDFKTVSLANASAAVLTSIAAIVLALLGAGVWALVARQLLFESALAVLLWRAARRALPSLVSERGHADGRQPPSGRRAFLVVSASATAAMTLDNMIVGATLDARFLGYYALAFSIGFAPLTQISWRFGSVLFPAAAATRDLATVGARTVTIVRSTSVVFFPLIPVAAVLAPPVVRLGLGDEWLPMVGPLRILLAVGAAHAITNVIGESLSGTGNIGRRAWWDTAWAGLTLAGVGVLAHYKGLDGAAAAHVIGLIPLVFGYVVIGSRLIGTTAHKMWLAVRDVLVAVTLQVVVTTAVVHALGGSGDTVAALVAAALGLVSAALVLGFAPTRPLRDVATLVQSVRSGRQSDGVAKA